VPSGDLMTDWKHTEESRRELLDVLTKRFLEENL
jgi:hypothetical protein